MSRITAAQTPRNNETPMTRPSEAGATSAVPIDDLLPLRVHSRIVHHLPGRLRVRVSRAALMASKGLSPGGFRDALVSFDGVRDCRLSLPTLSAIIDYDAERLPPDLWVSLIEGTDDEARAAWKDLVSDTTRATNQGDSTS